MVVLTAETCWALNEYWIYNKISGIKLVSLYSTIVRRIERNITTNAHVKHPLYMSEYHETSIFLTVFSKKKNPQISNFMKIRPAGAELFQADRRTDMTKLIVPSRSFANAPKFYFLRHTFIKTSLSVRVDLLCEIWGTRSGNAEGSCFQWCSALSFGEHFPTVRGIVNAFMFKVKQSKKGVFSPRSDRLWNSFAFSPNREHEGTYR